jgi:hypothetical protein
MGYLLNLQIKMAKSVSLQFNETNYEFRIKSTNGGLTYYEVFRNGEPTELTLEVDEKKGFPRSIYKLIYNSSQKSVFTEYGDNGLGLSIVSKIIDMVERNIKFNSRNK